MKLRPLPLLTIAALLTLAPEAVLAATEGFSTSPAPPQTGLQMPGEPLKGRKPVEIGSLIDAYGNAITPERPEKTEKKRLRSGAYGGPKEIERPLPDVKDNTPLW